MRRFILQHNIARFRERLAVETDPSAQRTLQGLLRDAERELAIAEAELYGAHPGPCPKPAGPSLWDSPELSAFRTEFHASHQMLMLLDHGPGLHIVDINRRFVEVTGVRREDIVGKPLFEAFPDNPDEPDASGVQILYDSLKVVLETSRPHAMDALRYDVRGADGEWVERWWRPVNAPLFDEHRRLAYILQSCEEIKAPATARAPCPADGFTVAMPALIPL
ncbi:PAS domain-containing protein [Phenylobacterium sp.]|uniref:PAS domain-containing protein n=1 Tax=Phenylobacterium sp. TaxID=1871053 RepID=UPI003918A889